MTDRKAEIAFMIEQIRYHYTPEEVIALLTAEATRRGYTLTVTGREIQLVRPDGTVAVRARKPPAAGDQEG